MKENFNLEASHLASRDSDLTYLDMTGFYLAHSKIFAKLSFITILMGFLAAVLYYDLNFFAETKYAELTALSLSAYVLYFIQITTAVSVVSIVFRRVYLHRYRLLTRLGGNLFYLSDDFKLMVVEILIVLMIPMNQFRQITFDAYNMNLQIYTTYSLNDIFIMMMAVRLYLLIELFLRNSAFSSFKMQKYLKLASIEDNMLFIVKCMINNYPYMFFALSFSLSLGFFSYLIRVCELPVSVADSKETFQSYINAVWMVTITMTTVGYSDYTPTTVPGRILTFFMIIWGIYLMSLIIIILFQSLELDKNEKQSLSTFNKLELKKLMYRKAAKAISERWLIYIKKVTEQEQFFKYLIEFRALQREIQLLDSSQSDNFYQKMNFYYDNMQASVQELTLLHQKISRFKNSISKISLLARQEANKEGKGRR